MKKMIYSTVIFLFLSFQAIAQECKINLDTVLTENETFLEDRTGAEYQVNFTEYFCPSFDELMKAKELMIKNYNDAFLTVPGGKEYFKPISDVREHLAKWKIQYSSYFDQNDHKNVYIYLINDVPANKEVLKVWKTNSVLVFDHSDELLTLSFVVNIDDDTVRL
ncbi:MAG: hypothetical protein RLN81_02195 [Balneolaceae bacterium]